MKNAKLIEKFRRGLQQPATHLLDELLRVAEPRALPLYLVGGPLRDLILDRPSLDIDIAVEGDAIALAHELADALRRDAPHARLGARRHASAEPRVVTHPRFGTATVRAGGFHLDLITARSETYARPGALPTVQPGSIEEDLSRRDFTINALALRLTGPSAGEILDPTGGQRDLDAKLIRVLHERSFQDDATRILRAFRYAARLGFAIEPQTLTWLRRDVRYLGTISGARIHHELTRILAENKPEDMLLRLDETGALTAIHPGLRFDRGHAEAFARLRDLHPTSARTAYWPVLASRLSEAEAASLARRLAATKHQREATLAMPALRELEPAHAGPRSRRDAPQARLGGTGGGATPHLPTKRSALAELLAPFPLPALWALAALTDDPTARDRLRDYLTKARHERPHLTGDDLLALGLPAGPRLGEILRRLTADRLDGEITSREDEERLASALIGKATQASHHTKKTAPSRSS